MSALQAAALVILSAISLVTIAGQAPGSRDGTRLLVLLVVDQMRADYIDQFSHQWQGGLQRLLDKGAVFRQAAYPYLNTVTCAGHATISTGSFPMTHGMILNQWWDRAAARLVGCTEDPAAPLVSYGALTPAGSSPHRLTVPTLTDALRAQGVGSRTAVFSLKDRSAIMLAGRRADAVAWFHAPARAWVTSRWYSKTPVPFMSQFVRAHPVEGDFGKLWLSALPPQSYRFADAGLGEKPPVRWTATFPHLLKGLGAAPDAGFYEVWQESPFSDAYLGRMAQAAIDTLGLGTGRGIDFLGVSFSALDFVGHDFGPRSHEVQDVLARLDVTIGDLLGHLDRVVGSDRYVVALSADHGVAPIPEQVAQEGTEAGRIFMDEVVARVDTVLARVLGPGKHVTQMAYTDLYLAPGVFQKLVARPTALDETIGAILTVPGVGRVLRGDDLRRGRSSGDPLIEAARLSYYAGRSGDLIVSPKPHWFFVSGDQASAVAATHGTAHPYDTRVPLILMGRGIKPGEYLNPATPADIAPTLAFLSETVLNRHDGRVLKEALTGAQHPSAASRAH